MAAHPRAVSALGDSSVRGLDQAFTYAQGQGLKEMDMLVWLGDFNYRVDAEYGEAKSLVRRNDLSPLLSKVCMIAAPVTTLSLISHMMYCNNSSFLPMCHILATQS